MTLRTRLTHTTLAAIMAGASLAMAADDLNPVTIKPKPKMEAIALFEKGAPKATLVIMGAPISRTLQNAVAELQTCLELTAGAKLPESKSAIPEGAAIVIGDCPEARAQGLDPAKMPIEGFAIKTAPNRIFIVGHDDDGMNSWGTAWGVYEFCERVVGVRWYWPAQSGGRSTVANPSLRVEPLWVEDAPAFRMREIWPSNYPGLSQLHAALRSNNSWPVKLQVHTPRWGNIEGFAEKHPEVFQISKDGKRDSAVLCYSNKETLRIYLEMIERYYDKGEKIDQNHLGVYQDSITVSPWDADVVCYCPECRALWNENGGSYGTASRILETFVAKLGTEVKKRWPGKTIIYLPYLNYTLASGTVKFPDNVEVQLCGMPGVALYKEPALNKQFQDNIDLWRKLTNRKVQTWEYSCWPEDRIKAPYHYPHVIKNYYTCNRDRIIGSFINGVVDHWPRSSWSLYCWMKCLWNPAFDVDAAAREFSKRMYGPAAEPMAELLALQISAWEDARLPGGMLSAQSVYTNGFTKEMLDRMQALRTKAHKLGDADPLVKQRIEYYETPFADCIREYESVIEGKGMTPLVMKKTGEHPVIDGKLDDAAWQKAPKATMKKYNGKENKAVETIFATTVQALWSPEGVSFGFHMAEPNPAALVKDKNNRDDPGIYWQDCVEIYLDASGSNTGKFVHLLLTAGGGIYDAFGGDTTWTCEGMKFASATGDGFWSMEVFVPMSALGVTLPTSSAGLKWYGQFCRNRMSDGSGGGRENQKLNANQGGFNSNTADFAELRFIE